MQITSNYDGTNCIYLIKTYTNEDKYLRLFSTSLNEVSFYLEPKFRPLVKLLIVACCSNYNVTPGRTHDYT